MPDKTTQSTITKEDKKKKNLRYQRDKDREMVKGIFKFYEVPGGFMSFVYKKYQGDKVERYDMYDGEVYTIPLGVAKHLNKNGWYPVHQYLEDDQGKAHMRVNQKVQRFGFQSLEFQDIEDMGQTSEIVTVEKIG